MTNCIVLSESLVQMRVAHLTMLLLIKDEAGQENYGPTPGFLVLKN